jgi:hypothetical protein
MRFASDALTTTGYQLQLQVFLSWREAARCAIGLLRHARPLAEDGNRYTVDLRQFRYLSRPSVMT